MKRLAIGLVILFGLSWGLVSPAADFDGDSRDDLAIFRPSTGLWAIRGVTRLYFGSSSDTPNPGDYNGDGIADVGIFRSTSGLWAIRGLTRIYFGGSSDTPISGGGGQRLYDYVVKPGDGADLVAALESNTYRSVFIPNGTYTASQIISVNHVRHIVGESKELTVIRFSGTNYMMVNEEYCQIEGIQFENGGNAGSSIPSLYINDENVTMHDCRFIGNQKIGLGYGSNADYLQVSNCYASLSRTDSVGFMGSSSAVGIGFTNCKTYNCGSAGFQDCDNLSSCEAVSNGSADYGFRSCERLSSCRAVGADNTGFSSCDFISACTVDSGGGYTDYGFRYCGYISSSYALACSIANWSNYDHKDSESCN